MASTSSKKRVSFASGVNFNPKRNMYDSPQPNYPPVPLNDNEVVTPKSSRFLNGVPLTPQKGSSLGPRRPATVGYDGRASPKEKYRKRMQAHRAPRGPDGRFVKITTYIPKTPEQVRIEKELKEAEYQARAADNSAPSTPSQVNINLETPEGRMMFLETPQGKKMIEEAIQESARSQPKRRGRRIASIRSG